MPDVPIDSDAAMIDAGGGDGGTQLPRIRLAEKDGLDGRRG